MKGMFLGIIIAVVCCAPGFWFIAQGHVLLGFALMFAPAVILTVSGWRDERKVNRQTAERAARQRDTIAAPVLAELDQTPEWWDSQYQALVRKRIPRDRASHDGHELEEPITFWTGGHVVGQYCIDCGVSIDTRT